MKCIHPLFCGHREVLAEATNLFKRRPAIGDMLRGSDGPNLQPATGQQLGGRFPAQGMRESVDR